MIVYEPGLQLGWRYLNFVCKVFVAKKVTSTILTTDRPLARPFAILIVSRPSYNTMQSLGKMYQSMVRSRQTLSQSLEA